MYSEYLYYNFVILLLNTRLSRSRNVVIGDAKNDHIPVGRAMHTRIEI